MPFADLLLCLLQDLLSGATFFRLNLASYPRILLRGKRRDENAENDGTEIRKTTECSKTMRFTCINAKPPISNRYSALAVESRQESSTSDPAERNVHSYVYLCTFRVTTEGNPWPPLGGERPL